MNSNKLGQLGWCQLSTKFTETDGIGDDINTYAFDGYRNVKWPDGKTNYGKLWDIGDIIGCGIDLDKKEIEYFINGESQGVAFKNVVVGENMGYFPGFSFSETESITINLGLSPFEFSYPGYEQFAIPPCLYNKSSQITYSLIDILERRILYILSSQEIQLFEKFLISNKIFNFLVNVAFKDEFLLKTEIIPFMKNLSVQDRIKDLQTFVKGCLQHVEDKVKFISNLMDNICCLTEEKAISKRKAFKEWNNYIKLFLGIIQINKVVKLWKASNNYVNHLKCIFSPTTIHILDLVNFMKVESQDSNITLYKAFKETRNKALKALYNNTEFTEAENSFSKGLETVLLKFLTDTRCFVNKADNKVFNLKLLLIDLANTGYDFGQVHSFPDLIMQRRKLETNFYKNFIFNLLGLFSNLIKNNSLDSFSIEPWFYRLQQDSLYFDEVGVGGTISHVTSEFGSKIDQKSQLLQNLRLFPSELNHRIIRMTSIVLVPELKEFIKTLERVNLFLNNFRANNSL